MLGGGGKYSSVYCAATRCQACAMHRRWRGRQGQEDSDRDLQPAAKSTQQRQKPLVVGRQDQRAGQVVSLPQRKKKRFQILYHKGGWYSPRIL